MQSCQEEEEEVGEEESRVTSHDIFLGRPEHSLGAPIPLPCDDGRRLCTYSYTLLSLLLSLLLPVVLTAQNCTFYANVGAESRHTPTADDTDAHPLTLPLVIDRFP